MAITFDPIAKIIQLDSFTTSEKELWTAFVDWSVISDNLKYGVGVRQVGGLAPIALYIYLELGWRIRPMEADGITNISGNILVPNGDSPIVSTIGSWVSLVNMSTPVLAVGLAVNAALTELDKDDIRDRVWNAKLLNYNENDSFGQMVGARLLTFAKWFWLKDE